MLNINGLSVDVVPMPDNTIRMFGFGPDILVSQDLPGKFEGFRLKFIDDHFTVYESNSHTIEIGDTDDFESIYVQLAVKETGQTTAYYEFSSEGWQE